MSKKPGRPRKNKDTVPIRVSKKTRDLMKRAKGRLTYDEFFDEVFEVQRIFDRSTKLFLVDGEFIQEDLAAARGFAITNAVKEGRDPNWPEIFLYLGADDGQ